MFLAHCFLILSEEKVLSVIRTALDILGFKKSSQEWQSCSCEYCELIPRAYEQGEVNCCCASMGTSLQAVLRYFRLAHVMACGAASQELPLGAADPVRLLSAAVSCGLSRLPTGHPADHPLDVSKPCGEPFGNVTMAFLFSGVIRGETLLVLRVFNMLAQIPTCVFEGGRLVQV